MKKFFTLIAMALVAVGVNAQTTTLADIDFTSDAWKNATFSQGNTNNRDVINGITFNAKSSTNQFAMSTSGLVFPGSNASASNYFFGIPLTGISNKITFTIKHGYNSGKASFLYSFVTGDAAISFVEAKDAKDADTEITVEVATTATEGILYFGRKSSNYTTISGITITTEQSGPADAVFSLTKSEINTLQSSQIIVGKKAGLDGLTMSNLAYNSEVITIDETGKITPVAAGTSSITFTTAAVDGKYKAGSANLSITVTAASLDEQANVTGSATWDWSKFGTTEIKFTEETTVNEVTTPATTPAKDEEFVLSNVVTYGWCDAIGSDFGNAKALKVKCEYPVRDGKYFQGGSIKFTTTVAGKLSVEYSNTGNRTAEADRRYLNVNGTNYGEGTMKSSENVTTSDIAVAAGEVVISGRKGTNTVDEQYLRIYKIVFTAGGTDGIQTLKSAQAANDATIYNLAGQKVSNGFKGIAIQNGKKVVIK